MKKILYIFALALAVTACSDDDSTENFRDSLYIDNENIAAEGSFVQGAQISDLASVTIPYRNARGGSAEIHAPESNGIYVDKQTVQMANGDGEAVVKVSGMPIALESTSLQLNIAYEGKTYISSVEIPVAMDNDPNGVIDFDIDQAGIYSLLAPVTIPFTVNPSMASVVISSEDIPGVALKVEQDLAAGTGVLTITPSAQFLSGTLELTAEFGARPAKTASIAINGFAAGNGEAAPYAITEPEQFAKIAAGAGMNYELTSDLDLGSTAPLAGTFTGSLEGNGHKVTYTIDTQSADNAALFAALGSGATVNDLVLSGAVTGRENVAALAAANNGATVTTVDASGVTVTGYNNVAEVAASGSGRDAAVLSFTGTPATVNIMAGNTSATFDLGISPLSSDVQVDLGETKLKAYSYNPSSGELTIEMPDNAGDFIPGDITFTARLAASGAGSNVSSTARTIDVKSEKMFESGTGTSGDPYMVSSAEQLNTTMTAYPGAWIELMNDVTVASWPTITATFTGNLDGAGYVVTGLDNPLVASLSGTIENIGFHGVAITSAAAGNIGIVSNTSSGTIRNVSVKGSLTRTASGGDQPSGSMTGEMSGGLITNCYADVTLSLSGNHGGGLVGRASGSSATKTITYCTVEGSLTSSAGTAFGGVLGRLVNNSGTVTITNCHSAMDITATGSSSNMVGGIFGACQPSSAGICVIRECLFTGTVNATAAAGGIAGVGGQISNCMVIGQGSETAAPTNIRAGADANNYPAAGIVASVKDDITNCIVTRSRISSPNSGAQNGRVTAGICADRNALNPSVTGCVVVDVSLPDFGNTILGNESTPNSNYSTIADNFWSGVTYYGDGSAYVPVGVAAIDGTNVSTADMTQSWYGGIGYDFSAVWNWNGTDGLPELKNAGCDMTLVP